MSTFHLPPTHCSVVLMSDYVIVACISNRTVLVSLHVPMHLRHTATATNAAQRAGANAAGETNTAWQDTQHSRGSKGSSIHPAFPAGVHCQSPASTIQTAQAEPSMEPHQHRPDSTRRPLSCTPRLAQLANPQNGSRCWYWQLTPHRVWANWQNTHARLNGSSLHLNACVVQWLLACLAGDSRGSRHRAQRCSRAARCKGATGSRLEPAASVAWQAACAVLIAASCTAQLGASFAECMVTCACWGYLSCAAVASCLGSKATERMCNCALTAHYDTPFIWGDGSLHRAPGGVQC
jgi:hypothetical protein